MTTAQFRDGRQAPAPDGATPDPAEPSLEDELDESLGWQAGFRKRTADDPPPRPRGATGSTTTSEPPPTEASESEEPAEPEASHDDPTRALAAVTVPADAGSAPPPSQPIVVRRSPSRPPAGPNRWLAGLVILAAASLTIIGGLVGDPAAPAPDPSESSVIAHAGELTREGLGPLDRWHSDSAAAVHVATYGVWRGVFGSVDSLTQARESVLFAAIVTVVLLGMLALRFGLSLGSTALTVAVAGAVPWALSAHRLVEPANFAVPWLLAALLFASPNARRRLAGVPAILCLVLAVLTAPLIGPAVLLAAAVLVGGHDIGPTWNRLRRYQVVVLLLAATAALLVVLAGDDVHSLGLRQIGPSVPPTVLDLVVVALAAVAAALGAVVRWLRPFAVVFGVFAAVAVFSGPVQTTLALIALPAGAIVLGAATDALARVIGGRARTPHWLAATPAWAGAVVAIAVGALVLSAAPTLGAADDGPADAVDWARSESGTATLLVDDAVWSAAADPGGLPDRSADQVVRYEDAVGPWQGTVMLIGTAPEDQAEEPPQALRDAWSGSVPLARFGRTQVRLVVGDVAAYRRDVESDAVARRAAATALLENRNLKVEPPAALILRYRDVDPRLQTVLVYLSAGHSITIGSFPAVPGEVAPFSSYRRARITEIDGRPVSAQGGGTNLIVGWLAQQQSPYQPVVQVEKDSLLLRYPAPSPLGLVPS